MYQSLELDYSVYGKWSSSDVNYLNIDGNSIAPLLIANLLIAHS